MPRVGGGLTPTVSGGPSPMLLAPCCLLNSAFLVASLSVWFYFFFFLLHLQNNIYLHSRLKMVNWQIAVRIRCVYFYPLS